VTKALRFIFGDKPNGPVEAVFPGAAWAARLRGLRHVYRAFVRLEQRRYVLAGCLFVLVVASVLMTQIRNLLRAMHPPQGGAYGVSDLSRVFSGDPPPHDVTQTWSAWYSQSVIEGHHAAPNPSWLGYWWLGIDTGALVPFYALLFAVLLLRGYKRIADVRGQRPEANIPAYARIAGVAFFLTPVLALVDWIENVMLAFLVHGSRSSVLAFAVRCVTGAKEFLFLIVLLAVLIVWVAVLGQRRPRLAVEAHPPWFRELRLVRVPAFAVFLFGLLFFGPGPLGEQTADVIRRLGDHFDASVVPFALVVLLAAVVAASCRRLLAVAHEEPRQQSGDSWWQRSWVSVVALGAGLAALTILVIFDVTGHQPPVGLYFPPALTAAIGLLNLAIGDVTRLRPALPPGPTFVSRLLTAAPLFLFGLAVLRAVTGDLFYYGGWRQFILFFVGLAFLAAGVGAYLILESLDRTRGRVGGGWEIGSWVAIVLGCAVALTLFGWTLANEEEVARVFGGTIAMITGFVILITLVGLGLTTIGEAVVVPAVFTVLRFRRIPVISLFVLWFVIASMSDRTGYHAIRTFESDTANAGKSTTTLEDAFDRWLASDPPTIEPRAGSERRIRPLVFVSSAGGGIRAAYWTDLVLDCLVDRAAPCDSAPGSMPAKSLFALSGVSGGALGLVEYSVHRTRPESGWVRARVGGDFLGAMFAHMFFIDSPNAFLRARWWTDRAAALEGSWERAWGRDSPLRTGLFQRGLQFPLLFLNGTSVTDGCRFETSILDIAPRLPDQEFVSSCRSPRLIERTQPAGRATWVLPATRELQSVICSNDDLKLSTAALLAARFPYVTPSGRVGCASEGRDPAYVVDGGYFEDSGASTVQYLVNALEPLIARHNRAANDCVVPLLIEIDNHYSDTSGPGREARPDELMVPTHTLQQLRSAHDAEGRLGGALAFGRVDPPGVKVVGSDGKQLDRVAFVFPRAHPGTEAPLGWAMSNISMNDLDRQLENFFVQGEITSIQGWFRPGTLACTAAAT
jgi:hypothetical protein